MKNIILFLFLMVTVGVTSQKKKERIYSYTASNGVTYKEGDTIVLNRGSGNNDQFVYVGTRGRGNGYLNGRQGAGYRLKIARMIKTNKVNYKGVDFILYNRMKIPFDLDIENAIKSCEVTPCSENIGTTIVQESDKYDKLSKIKKLKDEGILTNEEYESEKKKILDDN